MSKNKDLTPWLGLQCAPQSVRHEISGVTPCQVPHAIQKSCVAIVLFAHAAVVPVPLRGQDVSVPQR